jgi:tRNA uracil 4-sulfurtransferase
MYYVIAHYHELALKGRNRPMLVDRLVRNIREGLRGIGRCHAESLAGRIRISLEDPAQWPTIKSRL